jgi:hypothetical protein
MTREEREEKRHMDGSVDTRIYARQGDIGILFANGETPDGRKKIEPDAGGWLTLGHGASTGHRHAVAAKDADLYDALTPGGDLLLVVHRETRMEHPEHDIEKDPTKVLIPGTFPVRRQHEVFGEERRDVQD